MLIKLLKKGNKILNCWKMWKKLLRNDFKYVEKKKVNKSWKNVLKNNKNNGEKIWVTLKFFKFDNSLPK